MKVGARPESSNVILSGLTPGDHERLRSTLDSQAIVWVEGRLLPQEVEIAERPSP